MHLKSLTLKGFKSFASATTLRFEPGITCVVGPNGSGKSNVVDALTWVMGEQGAKSLRGGSMADVIFAGTSARAPLGRAEVTLTIDNSDGALPIDYSEVSVTRRVFRDGAGEYEINGSTCRLMDVQELLSDTGIGREMHVIVGQGRLATILESRPEDRRAFIEEAAGVLKHRRRKEKALRKLDGMAANLSRLADLTTELRRQLKPLGRQAEVARRAQTVQADLRDARLRLAADDLVARRDELARDLAAEAAAALAAGQAQERLDAAEAELAVAEAAAAELAPATEAAGQTWYRLSALAERVTATTRVAAERARHLAAPAQDRRGRDPEELDAEADRAAAAEAALEAELVAARDALAGAQAARAAAEQAATAAERAHLAAVRAVADRREGLARLAGEVDTLRSRVESGDAELARLADSEAGARERAAAALAEQAGAQEEAARLDAGEHGLDEQHERAAAEHAAAAARVAELVAAERAAGQDVASGAARVEALSLGLARRDGTAWLLEQPDRAGVGGPLSDALAVEPGWEGAVAAALGPVADALLAPGTDAAVAAVRALKDADGGRAGLVVRADAAAHEPAGGRGPLPDGARWALDLVTPGPGLAGALGAVLAGVVAVADLDAAAALVTGRPGLTAVTPAGDLVGPGWVVGGSDRAPSTLEVQAAVDGARAGLEAARHRVAELDAALAAAREDEAARAEVVEQTLAALHESDAEHAAVAERLGRLGQTARAAESEARRLGEQRTRLEDTRRAATERLADVEARLVAARAEPTDAAEPTTEERDAAAGVLAGARATEVEARLALRSAEERATASRGRADSLRRAARAEREARARHAAAEQRRTAAAALAEVVAAGGEQVGARVAGLVARAAAERDRVAAERVDTDRAAAGCRDRVRALATEVAGLTAALHRAEVARTEAASRLAALEEQVLDTLATAPDDLVAEHGPHVPLPPPADLVAEVEAARERGEEVSAPAPVPYVRAEQLARLKRAEKDLATLGKVNPLALEEFAALEERYTFLSTQLEDVRAARKDLLGVVADVDARILELFSAAYADVAAEFGAVFTTLFPGGEGRLVLTDPDDLLTTGVEVEARPPGKKITRLSLLSGGEKSLTAVAMLVAIFRARPSPFYVMDEVEAALDDTNLRRLITLFSQLREKSQLIVITHQKPTMEVADALYGVSMRGDGITTVISQRLRGQDLAPEPAVPAAAAPATAPPDGAPTG